MSESVHIFRGISHFASLRVFPWLRQRLSFITEIHVRHVVDKKTKMYFLHEAETYERNANDNSRLFHLVFATDREIFKDKFLARFLSLPLFYEH